MLFRISELYFLRPNAVVKIDDNHFLKSSTQQMLTDKDYGTNPKWNFPVKFTIDDAAANQNYLTLVVNLKSDRSLGEREIGQIHVPIKKLLDGLCQENDLPRCSPLNSCY
ncbi:hypothetical protein I3760_10G128000 [Carya illinoinensis]|nr:hypothetical protein I3760_10G128000 [Carya illinoinensis]